MKYHEDPHLDLHIGRRIYEARMINGWSQRRLADEAGVAYPRISNYENGTYGMTTSTLARLAKALGRPLEYFVKGYRNG